MKNFLLAVFKLITNPTFSVMCLAISGACFMTALLMGSNSCSHTNPTPTPLPSLLDGSITPNTQDGGVTPPSSIYEEACSNLVALECQEGVKDNCVSVLQDAVTQGITPINVQCLINATNPTTIPTCGAVACTVEVGATLATNCINACGMVKKFGCKEATTCLAECAKATAGKITDLKLACLVKAKTKAQLQGCGTVTCR